MKPDHELLRQYAKARSEEAFAEIVKRHVNLVYSAALRQVGGDAHLAHDVAQNVFTDLARKASSLSNRESLAGWLYSSVHFAASKIVRTETRRREREEQFMRESPHDLAPDADWEKLRPTLDSAMHGLNETDREAVLLRYFENRPYAEVGVKLGVNENTARMRVERALEKLRTLLAKRGIATTAALASIISANAIQTAPANLAMHLTNASLAGAGTIAFSKFMITTKLKLALSTLAVTSAVVALVIQHQTQKTLRTQNELMAAQITQLRTDSADLSNRLSTADNSELLASNRLIELMRLRAQVDQQRAGTPSTAAETSEPTNALPETNKVVVNLKIRFASLPNESMSALRPAWASPSSGSGVLTSEQFKFVREAMRKTGNFSVSDSQITMFSGHEAAIASLAPVLIDGTNASVGVTLKVAPYASPDASTIRLDLAAKLSQLTGDPSKPDVQTVEKTNQITLLLGQTAVLQKEIPVDGWFPDLKNQPDGPKNLLVFVTPEMGDPTQPLQTPPTTVSSEAAMMKLSNAKQGVLALVMFASDNENQLPTNLVQTSRYLKDGYLDQITTNFDLLAPGFMTNITSPSTTILLREKQAWQSANGNGKWMKSYGFADGHAEIHTEPNGNFDDYEKERTVSLPQ